MDPELLTESIEVIPKIAQTNLPINLHGRNWSIELIFE